MSISRGWIAALAVTVFMVAGPAQAAPVLYTFTGGSAVLRVTSGAFTLSESAPLALGGVFATFDDAGSGELVDFEFSIVPEQTVTLDVMLGSYDTIQLHTATLTPGVGYTHLFQQNNGGGNFSIVASPVLTSTTLDVMSSVAGPPDVPFVFVGNSDTPLVATVDIIGGTALTLDGITIGSFTSADFSTIPAGQTLLVKMDLSFQGMVAVPEPTAAILIGLGCVGLAILRARRI
jgi:hypothetical protein